MKIERKILLNPGPATTSDEVKFAMLVPDICPREEEFGAIMNTIKEDLPKVVNAGDEYTSVMFTASGTGGVEAVITSAIPAGGKILVVENGAYGTRMAEIAETYKIPTVRYRLAYGDFPDVATIKRYLDEDATITHVGIIDHETTTGMRNPVQEVCDTAHALGREVIVDCMSSFAGLPIDLQRWQADYIVSSSNKCIQGMPGLVFVIFKKSALNALKENKHGRSFYFDIYSQYDGFRNTGQMPFTPPVQVVYALRKALDLFFEETAEGRIRRYRRNYEVLKEGLSSFGFRFLLEDRYQSGLLIAVCEPANEDYDFNSMHDFFYARGYTIYPGKGAKELTFRLSVLGDLYEADIRSFLKEMSAYLSTLNEPLKY
ncbi:MAG: 2-aminoethylphosphonate--pyruvate transaminase [Culturomica sp.]|jgi:2-aminoethylphosphonate aminotransferase|nr:2-aminoethylphosphonate--pyruvate transaminase [Culturomica sp.]